MTTLPTKADPPTLAAPSTTAVPSATATRPAPTITLTPTLTGMPTPPLDPMAILSGRAKSYPGSAISIANELPATASYHRYYAWYRSDGLKIYGLLTVPTGTMPAGGWPAIVFNHGYIPPYLYHTLDDYAFYVDSLASHGYVVFKIDYRGNASSEGVVPANDAYSDPGYEDDVLNALASLQRYPQVNPQKIGMWGHSMGGFLTLRAMVISQDIRAGVIWAGVVGSYPDMLSYWNVHGVQSASPYESVGSWYGWIQQYGSPEQNPQFWDSISATSYLSDLSGPLQLHHALFDWVIPYSFSQTLAQDVQAAGKTVELYPYPSYDHNLMEYFTLSMQRTIGFFDKYVK